MKRLQGPQAAGNIVSLFDDKELADQQLADQDASAQSALEAIMANPRFTAPANDEPQLHTAAKPAPARADCREAKLLCMWVEILAESEIA